MILKTGLALVLVASVYLINLIVSDKQGQQSNQLKNRPNVVLFTVDTLRADHLSVYGYNRNTSANLASIIDDSVVFNNAYSVATYSAPAYASLLTGLYPQQFGTNNNQLTLPENITSLAEVLQQYGYATAAFVGDTVISEEGNFNQGFETFSVDNIHADSTISVTKAWAERGWIKAKNWLDSWFKNKHSSKKNPFFLWFHANHPHGNYSPPPQYRNLYIKQAPEEVKLLESNPTFSLDSLFRKHLEQGEISQKLKDWVIAQYDGEVTFSDYIFGQLITFLKQKGEYDNTLIIFVADHGEVLFEHIRPGKIRSAGHHANLYYYPVLKIPLIIKPIKSSSIIKGKAVNGLVSSVDLYQTIIDLLAIENKYPSDSQSFVSLLKNPLQPHRSQIFFSGLAYNNECSGLINQQWQLVKCIQAKQKKLVLFNLKEDPQQNINYIENNPEQLYLLENILDNWKNKLNSDKKIKHQLSQKMKEHLEKSGYLDKRENL